MKSSQSGLALNNIPVVFVRHAAEVLGDTSNGLSGGQIIARFSAYSVDFGADIPYASYPFPNTVPNKRTALYKNLLAFNDAQRYQIIRDLCDLDTFHENRAVRDLLLELISRYGHPDTKRLGQEVNADLVEQTRHWLSGFPDVLNLLDAVLEKYKAKIFDRYVLDDLRLGFHKLSQQILGNHKSLETRFQQLEASSRDVGVRLNFETCSKN